MRKNNSSAHKHANSRPPAFREGYKLPDFLRDDAFALRSAVACGTHSLASTKANICSQRRIYRIKCAVLIVAIFLVIFFSLGLGFSGVSSTNGKIYSPIEAWSNLINWALYNFGAWVSGLTSSVLPFGEVTNGSAGSSPFGEIASNVAGDFADGGTSGNVASNFTGEIFGIRVFEQGASLIEVAPLYAQVTQRAGLMLTTCVCGALLACAGMLYQVVFKNPIASPSLLGVTHGVQVGLLFIFAGYGAVAFDMLPERFAYGYIGGALALLVVFALSKLITKRKTSVSVFDILVIGTIISAFLGAVREYLLDVLSALNLWVEFFEYQEALNIYSDPLTYAVLAVSVVVCFAPIFILRHRLNLLVFEDGEIRLLGGNPRALRVLAIIAGSGMILTAQIFVGSASCFALVIPFLSRYLFGSEFSRQLVGNVLLGALVLLVCRVLTALIPFVGIGLPIGVLAGAITLPIFVWASAGSGRGW